MSAEAEIKQLIDRILRLKEEQDARGEDIREVYAEAKGRGYDKTVLGNVVSHLRKLDKVGRDALNEREAIFDLYLTAYETGGRAHAPARTRENIEEFPVELDREARRKQRMSESMDDSVVLSAEAVALGLIDPAAHEETVRIADAVARKFGNGPLNEQIDPDTGEITNSLETAIECAAPEKDAAADERNVEATVEQRSSATHFEPPAFLQPKPVKTARDYRPHCQKPDACGATGLTHCYSCSKMSAAESEVA